MLVLKIAWRNIFRQRRRSLLTILTMFGGFTLAAISIGWADGTYNRIIDAFTRNRLGHIQLHAVGYLDRPSIQDRISDCYSIGRRISSLPGVEAFDTPLGRVPVDAEGVRKLALFKQVVESRAAHAMEHSLEVQLPFLQSLLGEFSLLPLAVGDARPQEVRDVIERVWGPKAAHEDNPVMWLSEV